GARVEASRELDRGELVDVVKSLGFSVLPEPEPAVSSTSDSTDPSDTEDRRPEDEGLRHRFIVSLILSLPVLIWSMIPATQFDNWQWISLTLTAPVVFWAAWPIHR